MTFENRKKVRAEICDALVDILGRNNLDGHLVMAHSDMYESATLDAVGKEFTIHVSLFKPSTFKPSTT